MTPLNHDLDVVLSTLDDLVTAVDSGDWVAIGSARTNAVDILGYDPAQKEQDFLVSLEIGFVARTPEEAVEQFIALVQSDGLRSWVYRVTDENENESTVDSYGFNK